MDRGGGTPYARCMGRVAALILLVAGLALVGLRGGDDPLARARYRIVYAEAKRECTGIGVIEAPQIDSSFSSGNGSVQFTVTPSPKLPASDRRAFFAGCRAGAAIPRP